MTVIRAEGRSLGQKREAWAPAGAVLLGALMLAWPAFYNGFPLLYADSMTYLGDGRVVARAVFLHRLSDYYGVRSFFYSLGIRPWHWNLSPWPVVALQCLLVAFVLGLVARSIAPRRTAVRYLLLMLGLSLLSSVGWYADFIMPDILGPVLYLAIYLLVFAPETLGRAERVGLYLIAWWAVTAHASHLLLAGLLLVLLALYAAVARKGFGGRMRALGRVAAIVALAAGAQMALHGYLYGQPSLNGERPPYLMARLVADGPGRWYLQKHCPQLQWVVCAHLKELTGDPDDFLWGPDGAYETVSNEERQRMAKEELPFVLATVRAYPGEQLERSGANFLEQLRAFGLYGFDPSPWILSEFDGVLPRARASYVESRQARDQLPLDLLTEIQYWVVVGSLAAIAGLIPFLWRRHSPRLGGLGFVVGTMVVANAAVTGVLSVVDDRYGCRVIWLIPLLAGVMLLDLLHQRETGREAGAARVPAAASA